MSLDDWILAFHLLSAFALVAAMTVFWVVFVALRESGGADATVAGLMRVGAIAVGIGSLGTLVFGIWLAISLDAYQVWDGWVIAAIVLWAIAVATGKRSGDILGADPGAASEETKRRALLLHGIASVLVVLVLVDMIWKPGA
ncbi:MAG TPA: hypothetical protein VFR43_08395 [Gaiellaceae bacterium]|nr:hypothetical protein [Gaiellaceae bacterium]